MLKLFTESYPQSSHETPNLQVVRESDYAEVIEPGQYVVYAGGSQPGDSRAPANVLMGSFEVSGDETPLSQCTSL